MRHSFVFKRCFGASVRGTIGVATAVWRPEVRVQARWEGKELKTEMMNVEVVPLGSL